MPEITEAQLYDLHSTNRGRAEQAEMKKLIDEMEMKLDFILRELKLLKAYKEFVKKKNLKGS